MTQTTKHMGRTCAAAAVGLSLLAGSTPAVAAEVTLEALEGDNRINGELLNFADGVYTVRAGIGVLQIDAALVTCAGPGCPEVPPSLSIAFPFELSGVLKPALDDYLASQGLSTAPDDDPETQDLLLMDDAGAHIGRLALADASDSDAMLRLGFVSPSDEAVQGVTLGRDAIVATVPQDMPLRVLTTAQFSSIMSGAITTLEDVGAGEGAIRLRLPKAGSLASAALVASFPNTQVAQDAVPETSISDADSRNGASDMIRIGLMSDPLPSGYRHLAVALDCGPAITASPFSVASGAYPFTVDAVMQLGADVQQPMANGLLGHLAEQSFPPRPGRTFGLRGGIEELPLDQQGDHVVRAFSAASRASDLLDLQSSMRDLEGAVQLSTVFRFSSTSARPGPDAEALARTLADHLAAAGMDGKSLIIHGFSDGLESGGRRVGLSRARAEVIRRLLEETAADADWTGRITTDGLEGLAPRGCNDTVAGRTQNRRVEIWITTRR